MKRHRLAALALIGALIVLSGVLAGCSTRTTALKNAAPEMPGEYAGAVDGVAGAAETATGEWWKSFDDPALDAFIGDALGGNLDIRAACSRLDQARAAVGVAKSARLPKLDVNATGGRTRTGAGLGASSVFGASTYDTFKLSAAAAYEVDLFRRLKSRADASRFDMLAATEDLDAAYISISAEAADLYYLVVESRAQLELADRTIASFEDTLERVERRYDAGLVGALDLYQSRQSVATARALRPQYESRLEVAEHALSIIAGRVPTHGVIDSPAALPEPPEITAGVPSTLLERRPDIRAAYLRLRASNALVAAAVADRFPVFNLVGDYGGASTNVATLLDSPNILWNLLVQAALPVVDGGRRAAEVERAEAAFDGSLAAYRSAVLKALAEVEDALSKGRATSERIKLLEERRSAAEAALRLSLDRYMQGLSDYLPVLTAQQGYYDAESALLGARRELISNRIQLARALGGDWPAALRSAGLGATDTDEREINK